MKSNLNKEKNKMTKKKYFYTYDEYSQDTRSYEIESDVKLTKSEVQDIALGCSLTDGYTYVGGEKDKRFKATFTGTEYGDDAQVEYAGEFQDDEEKK
tara:strand:+ start:338 stop:628 length:291 start_codon:yes stop_codon:yes gene_type:complete